MATNRFIRPAKVDTLFDFTRSTRYVHIGDGLLPPPMELGKGHKGFLESEILAVQRARIAGSTDDQVRALVKELVEKRTAIAAP